jgi:hypothetical protein
MAKIGDLKVWWVPQVPMKAFEYPVKTPQEGAILCDALAMYDLFQYENNIKPDYSNAGGLVVYQEEDTGWTDWCAEDGTEFEEFMQTYIEGRKNL